MTESLFSANWHRVAKLEIRLRDGVSVTRQFWRGELWYLLNDELSGSTHRINKQAYQFVGRCDGDFTVQQVWDALLLELEDLAPTQDEVIELILHLNQLSLLYTRQGNDVSSLFERRKTQKDQKKQHYMNPFAIRLPLGDPSKWLNKLDNLAQTLFKPVAFYGWLLLILSACLVASVEWSALMAYAKIHMLTPRYLTMTIICYPLVKALHELCHALAIRRWQGGVHEFGISLLVFVPAPYVDASAANAFPLRSQRMVVGAAGIIAETCIAAIALLVFVNVPSGLMQDIAFVCMVIGSVSTLLFNGNPLLRFDGYYVLSDYLDIPNLATRSQQYWHALLTSAAKLNKALPFELAKGERKWLLLYSPLSLFYKIFISIVIALWVGSHWFLMGVVVIAYMTLSVIIKPIYNWLRLLFENTASVELPRLKRNLAIFGFSLAFGFFVIPFPFATVTPAVVWMPEQAQIRPAENGFIKALPVKSGDVVAVDDVIAVLDNPVLSKQRDKLSQMLESLEADRFQILITEPVKAANINEKMHSIEQQLSRINEQISALTIKAKVNGKLIMPKQQDRLNSYVKRGDALAYIFQDTPIKVRAVVPEKDAYLVKNQTRDIDVWLADSQQVTGAVKMAMDTPAATRQLPSPALGDQAGGPYLTDPIDETGTSLLSPVFLFDLTILDSNMQYAGGKAFVKFKHDAIPLAEQLYQRARQLFMKSFEPRR